MNKNKEEITEKIFLAAYITKGKKYTYLSLPSIPDSMLEAVDFKDKKVFRYIISKDKKSIIIEPVA